MLSASSRLGPEFAHDESSFRHNTPYLLISTNLKGAYGSPPSPDDLNLSKAGASELLRYGLHWRRPSPTDNPLHIAAWEKVFSRKWLAKDRVIPHLVPQLGRTHLLKEQPPPRLLRDGTYLSEEWAGVGLRGGPWFGVIGFWDIPAVSKPPAPQGLEGGWTSCSWIGLDGFDIGALSNDALQAGIEQKVDANGQASYVAWFEWFARREHGAPQYIYQTNISNFAVGPGQRLFCSVQYNRHYDTGHIYFANETTGQHVVLTLAPPPDVAFKGDSAEWIMEAPDFGEPITSLPKFSPVKFTSAIACGTHSAVGNPEQGIKMNIETPTGQVLTSVEHGNYSVTIDFVG